MSSPTSGDSSVSGGGGGGGDGAVASGGGGGRAAGGGRTGASLKEDEAFAPHLIPDDERSQVWCKSVMTRGPRGVAWARRALTCLIE